MNYMYGLILLTLSIGKAELLLVDSFDGSNIDSTKWDQIIPFGSSSLTVENGYLKSVGRGTLVSKQEFQSPYVLSGTFTSINDWDLLAIILRSDGQITPGDLNGGLNGLAIGFHPPPSIWSGGGLNITRSGIGLFYSFPLSFNPSQEYDFKITDYGSTISVNINGNDLFSLSTDFSAGSKIAFLSREPQGSTQTESRLIQVQVATVPEPSALSLLAVGLGVLFRRSRKRD
ncbi:MAG: PEP-CTERM sorting domain-containing protein [Chitinophagia bacterium]|nr:PEP-CTERM sorting domain-containing protein [Chitinophagia bacterium]